MHEKQRTVTTHVSDEQDNLMRAGECGLTLRMYGAASEYDLLGESLCVLLHEHDGEHQAADPDDYNSRISSMRTFRDEATDTTTIVCAKLDTLRQEGECGVVLLECYGDPADTDSYSEFHGFCVLPHEHDGEHQNIPFGEYHERRDASLPPLAQFEIIVVDDEQE